MPLYDYRCLDCNDKFEVLVKNSLEEVICPNCGSKNVKNLYLLLVLQLQAQS
ncbi:MAG: FmdB family zinc ribbon protein [bacterium]